MYKNEFSLHVSLLSNAVAITNHFDDFIRYTSAYADEKESAIGC